MDMSKVKVDFIPRDAKSIILVVPLESHVRDRDEILTELKKVIPDMDIILIPDCIKYHIHKDILHIEQEQCHTED